MGAWLLRTPTGYYVPVLGSWEGNTGMGPFSLAEARWHYVSMDEILWPMSWGPGRYSPTISSNIRLQRAKHRSGGKSVLWYTGFTCLA